ncbi:MAG: DUF3107 domain-containing protein [Actinomycetota bacterium]
MTEVRIGITQVSRELSVDVDGDAEDVAKQVTDAVADPNGLLWLTDSKGKRVGITVAKLAYVEVEAEERPRSVGFAR